MRILHTGDWHLGKPLGPHSRLPEQAAFIDELAEIVREKAVDLVVVAGDVFDTHNPPADAERLFYHALKKLTTARSGVSKNTASDSYSLPEGAATRDTTTRNMAARDTVIESVATEDTAIESRATEDTAIESRATEDTATRDTATEDTATRDTATEDTAPNMVVPVVVVAGNHDNPTRLAASSPIAQNSGALIVGTSKNRIPTGTYAGFDITRSIAGCFEIAIRGHRATVVTIPFPSPHLVSQVASQTTTQASSRLSSQANPPLSSQASQSLLSQTSQPLSSQVNPPLSSPMSNGVDTEDSYAERVAALMDKLAAFYREDTVNVLVGHFFLAGGVATADSERPLTVGGAYAVDGHRLPRQAQYVAMGHLHRPQRINGHPCAYYAGSPIQFSQSEVHYAKCVLLADITPGCVPVVEKIYLRNYKPLEIWEADSIEAAVALATARADTPCWAALHIKTTRPLTQSEIRQIRSAKRDIIEIRPIMESPDTPNLTTTDKERTPGEMFAAFYREKKNAPPSNALITLFAALSRQAEDG